MIRLEMKNYNQILTEKQLKYHLQHHVKLVNMNILQVNKYYKATFPYSLLGKSWEKRRTAVEDQGQKQVQAIEDLGKQLVKSNTFFEKEKSIPLDKQKEIFYNLVAENGTGEM